MSELNQRRHGMDLHIRDKDLLTGRDARRLIADEFARRDADEQCRRVAEAIAHDAAVKAHNALPWWKRAWIGLAFRAPLAMRRNEGGAE